jgi:hypothetical protein
VAATCDFYAFVEKDTDVTAVNKLTLPTAVEVRYKDKFYVSPVM